MLSVIRHSVAQSGIRSLYTGLSASLLRQMTYSLVRLGSYESMKSSLSENGKQVDRVARTSYTAIALYGTDRRLIAVHVFLRSGTTGITMVLVTANT